MDEPAITTTWIHLFDQIWNDKSKLEDVTDRLCEHVASVYQENSPERIYFLMLYNIFNEFLEDISADVLPNDLTGYQDSLIWQKLYNFQRDAATGIVNKLETYSGCKPPSIPGLRSRRNSEPQLPFSTRSTSTSSNCSTPSLSRDRASTLRRSTTPPKSVHSPSVANRFPSTAH